MQFLLYAELQAQNRKPMHMADWVKKLDAFLEFNEQSIFKNAENVSHQLAQDHAEREFEKFEAERRAIEARETNSDFDRVVEEVKGLEKGNGRLRAIKKISPRKPKK